MTLKQVLAACCALFAIVCLLTQSLSAADARPNIIWIMADDLGYGDLGCFGQKHIKTPHLDKMAAEGMKLTNFYAGATVCAPSRCVLMTGLHTGHCQVRGNSSSDRQTLTPKDVTIAKVLQDAGYHTGMIGKWGLGEPGGGEAGHPNKQGFDYSFGYLSQFHAHNYYPEILWRNSEKVMLRNEVKKVKSGPWGSAGYATKRVDYSHDLFMEDTLKFVDQKHTKPFFLYLPYTIPHANNEGTRGTGNGQEVPDYGIYAEKKDWPDPNKGQAAMITRMDAGIGKLFALLKEKGLDENTLVIFTSDNGHHKEGGNNPDFFDANGPLRGMKRDLYEGGIRVPTIARWPGKIKPGTVSDHVAYFGDLFATACDLAGLETPKGLDSISFVPTLTGKGQQQEHVYLYWEFYEQGSKQAVRAGKWKAIRMPMHTGKVQLYDLEKDLGEENDIAKKNPEMVAELTSMMDNAHTPNPLWQIRGKAPKK